MHPRAAPLAVAEGLFTIEGGQTRLIGTRCHSCDATYFPQTISCRNPGCSEKHIEACQLSPTGTLYSWTLQHYRPPAPFRMDEWKPYLIGLVDLPEGLRVLGMLDLGEAEAVIGLALRLDHIPLYLDDKGMMRSTYCFVTADPPGLRL